jgi:hypothetical protein
MRITIILVLSMLYIVACKQNVKPQSLIYLASFDHFSQISSEKYYQAKDIKNDSLKYYTLLENSELDLKIADSFLILSSYEVFKELKSNFGNDEDKMLVMEKKAAKLLEDAQSKKQFDSLTLSKTQIWLSKNKKYQK